ncbi:MAG: DNA polymerase I [Chthonomonas sp.]|nr:DNA polymerase I [Chthonomonas sp.]
MPEKRLILIDGFSLLYRAFYGNKFMSTTDGRPTNALYGFCAMIFRMIETEKPAGVLVALDAPGKTFRHAEYAEYKGTRREMPEEMRVQLPVARELIKALGIPQIELTGWEADDIVGTLSLQAEQHGYKTTIVTGDLDSLQLVDEQVSVVTPKVGVTEVVMYDPAAVRERYGFEPDQLRDYKALAGDTSDNIPGVPGIGDKSAKLLIDKFGTVEEMLDRLEEVPDKFRTKIETAVEAIPKWKDLCTIRRDAPIEWDFAQFQVSPSQYEAARKMLESLEFRNFVKRLPLVFAPYLEGAEHAASVVETVVERVEVQSQRDLRSGEDLRKWIDGKPFAVVAAGPDQAGMFDDGARTLIFARDGDVVRLDTQAADPVVAEHLALARAHDAKSMLARLQAAKLSELQPVRFDAMLAGYVLQSGRAQYAMRDLIQGYLDVEAPESAEACAVGLDRLEAVMRNRLEREGQMKILDEIEGPLAPVLAEMERHGIAVSRDFLTDFSKSLDVQIRATAQKVYELAGQEFVIGSPKQLGEILFDKLGIPGAKKTKTGYATGAEILQTLEGQYPIATQVLAWRELTKLKSTYADALPRMIGPDGRIHTSYNQTVAATGRLSSNEPNLQNIPIRTELGRQIRRAFVAAPGTQLVSLDYSQIELRLLAHLCKDSVLVEAFSQRVDVHTVTAALMFHVDEADVTKEQRRLAKMLNYAVLYGVTDFGLANQLGGGFSISEAKQLIQQYNERFPTVKAFTESVVEDARAKGFTTTMLGRRRYFPDIHAANRNERTYAERQAINAPIQGAAADMIKVAMLNVRRNLGVCGIKMLLQVHDELVFEMTPNEMAAVGQIRSEMENAMPLDVPTEVDAKAGANWSDMALVPR